MSEHPASNRPADTITLNGHRYVSEDVLASWGTVEIMVRNAAVSERISDLEARLEKAREVVEPFAEAAANCIDDDERRSATVWEHPVGMALQVGDFRDARAWMEQNDEHK